MPTIPTLYIVSGNSDIGLNKEFINIKNWATANKMIINNFSCYHLW